MHSCFVEGSDAKLYLLTYHEKSQVFRLWDTQDGSLRVESKIATSLYLDTLVPISLPIVGCALIQTTKHEIILYDVERGQQRSCFSGYSKQNSIRFVNLFAHSLLAVIDCFGQLCIYDLSVSLHQTSIAEAFTERKFSESFSVSISSHLMVLVCPLKLVVYRRNGTDFQPFRTILSPDVSILWKGVTIFPNKSIVAFSNKPGTVWNVSDDDILPIELVGVNISRIVEYQIFVDQSTNQFYELFFHKSKLIVFPVGIVAEKKEPVSRTFASDGPHLFLVEYTEKNVQVYPLSIQDCSIDLVIPENAQVTCVSGSVVPRRLVIGTLTGSVFVYIVGTSKMETRFETDVFGTVGLISFVETNDRFFGAIDFLGGVHLMEYNHETGEVTRRLKMKINFLLNLTIFDFQYNLKIKVLGDIVKIELVDFLNDQKLVYVEEWSLVTKRVLRVVRLGADGGQQAGGDTAGQGANQQINTVSSVLDGCCEIETERGSLCRSNGATILLRKILKQEKDLISNLWLSEEPCWKHMGRGVAVISSITRTVQAGISESGSDMWRNIIGKFFDPLRPDFEISINGGNFDFLINLVEYLVRDKFARITSLETIRLIRVIICEITRMIIGGFPELESRINSLVYEQKNLLIYSCMVGIVPKYLKGYSDAVSAVFDKIATEEEVRRKTSLISAITSRRQSVVTVISDDTNILFHVEMAREIFSQFTTNDVRLSQLPLLLTMSDSYSNLRKLVVDKEILNGFFFSMYSIVNGEENHRLSSIAIDVLTSIGFNNSMKFAKRLAAMIKAKHESVVPLMLVQKLMEMYARHSIRILPMLMEIVILPCLDSLDYRLRKNSIQPTSDVFKSMNRLFPMTAFHQNRQKFAIGSTQGQVFVYDIRSATKWRVLDGHTGAISAVGFDPSGKHICTYSATDCTVRVWYLASGGVASAGPVVVSGTGGAGSVLSGLLGTTGGKCIQVKQLGATDHDDRSGIKHPFTLIHRIQSVKIRWTSESDILLMRENGEGAQIKI